jgi:hypothetical protein
LTAGSCGLARFGPNPRKNGRSGLNPTRSGIDDASGVGRPAPI